MTWADVASELRSGRGPEHVTRIADVDTVARRRELATALVSGLLARSLVESVGARHRLDWSGLGLVVDAEGRAYPVAEVARAAVESAAGVEDLLTFAVSYGIPTDQELTSVSEETVEEDTEPHAVGAVGPLERGRTTVLTLASTGGLAIVPMRGVVAHFRLASAVGSAGAAHRLGTWLLRDGFEAMLARPGTELLAWDDIVAAGILLRGVRRPALAIALASGEERMFVIRRKWDSTDADDPWGALRPFLGDRFTGQRSPGVTGSRVGVR